MSFRDRMKGSGIIKKPFLYHPHDWAGTQTAEQINEADGKRWYAADGVRYPSITRILSWANRDKFTKWTAEIGEDKARAMKEQGGARGRSIDAAIEFYCTHESFDVTSLMPHDRKRFESMRKELDAHVSVVRGTQCSLVSHYLRTGGTLDLWCIWAGENAILDAKTMRNQKDVSEITGYFMQAANYGQAVYEYTGIRPTKLVILGAVDGDTDPVLHVEDAVTWLPRVKELADRYHAEVLND